MSKLMPSKMLEMAELGNSAGNIFQVRILKAEICHRLIQMAESRSGAKEGQSTKNNGCRIGYCKSELLSPGEFVQSHRPCRLIIKTKHSLKFSIVKK